MGGGCLGWSAIVYMSSGMFRGKESSNRIELSRLVQDLLNFGVSAPCSSGGGGWVDVGGGWLGSAPHTHAHECACTHMHTHMVNMIISCKWPPPLGESLGIPYEVICTCACVCIHAHAYAHVWGSPSHHPPHPPTLHPPGGDPRNQSKFNST